jgi:hypothetical protein
MPDNDDRTSGGDGGDHTRYDEAVESFRTTTKWVIASAGGLAAFLLGTDPLTHFGKMEAGNLWFLGALSLYSLLEYFRLPFGY